MVGRPGRSGRRRRWPARRCDRWPAGRAVGRCGSTITSFTIRFGAVMRRQVLPASKVFHKPSVVPAYTIAGFTGSWCSTRVRRAEERDSLDLVEQFAGILALVNSGAGAQVNVGRLLLVDDDGEDIGVVDDALASSRSRCVRHRPFSTAGAKCRHKLHRASVDRWRCDSMFLISA